MGFDGGGVDTELAATRDLEVPRQLNDAIIELLYGRWPNGVGPADQGGVVGDLLQVDAAELAKHHAVVDEEHGLGVAPAVKPHDHEHAEDDFDGSRAAAVHGSQGIATGEVGANAGVDLVVIKEAIELSQLGLELKLELRHEGEQIDRFVAITEHGGNLRDAVETADLPTAPKSTNR